VSQSSATHVLSGMMDLESTPDQRRYERYPLQVVAHLALPGGDTYPCRISDFGAGGVFLTLEETGSGPIIVGGKALERDDKVVLQFSKRQGPSSGPPQPEDRLHSIHAPVARVLPTGVGLDFTTLDAHSIQALRQLIVVAKEIRAPASPVTAVDPTSVKPPAAVVGDVMHTTRCLLWLERLMGSANGLPETAAAIATSQPSVSPVDPQARQLIIEALITLQLSPEFLVPDESQPLALQDRLMAIWKAMGLEVTDADGIVVEIVSKLLDSMLDDPLVDAEIKHCIRRLAVSLVKVALQDESVFFADEQHPARLVLNRLGSLEPSIIGGDRWHAAVDPLMDQIVAESDPRGAVDGDVVHQSVFNEVLPQLDTLFEEQGRRYDEIVAEVVRKQSKQETLLDSLRTAASAVVTAGSEARQSPPLELQRWLSRVDQLQAGDLVYRRMLESRTERLSLAMVCGDRCTYLFVDAAGNKAATVTRQELAMQLRRGELWMVDAFKLPIVERSLFQMLNGLHTRILCQVNMDKESGLLNRKGLEARVEQASGAAVTMGSSHALCILELDAFAAAIEKCGQQVGDEMLRKFIPVLEHHVRAKGIAARLQAGRIAVLLRNCTADRATALMEEVRAEVETLPCEWHQEYFRLTISAGLAPIDAHSGSVSVLFEAAEGAYREAREAGGNRVRRYEKPRSASEGEVADGSMITRVLANGGLQLRCQQVMPIGADGSALPHYELLLGVKNEDGENTLPGAFLQAAQRSNRMPDVDRWVIQTALRWMAGNSAKVDQSDGYSINVSGMTLADESLVHYVRGIIAQTGVPPEKVMFEVTESLAIDSSPVAVNFMHAMKEYGCRFSLDRFGNGEASLAHLETLPVDYVKIDGSLVRDIAFDPRDLKVVRSLNEIGHFLGKKTVAECVESQEVLARLRQIGVDYAQGFEIGQPYLLE
jgi:diguanylate cyclase (GGDEF)-like protein